MKNKKKNNIIDFPTTPTKLERQVEAILFAASEPLDIETIFNVPGGHWHHSELQIDRMYSLRPVFKYSSYRTPINGLYICGAGTHPGGGISGKSGINAANQIIKDQKQNKH